MYIKFANFLKPLFTITMLDTLTRQWEDTCASCVQLVYLQQLAKPPTTKAIRLGLHINNFNNACHTLLHVSYL